MSYDAIVVGARCAGSPVAMLLARLGYRVLIVDKAAFPSDVMSTHYIHLTGVARLKRWGLLDEVLGTNCPPIEGFRLDLGPVAAEGEPAADHGIAFGLCPRRILLDQILVDAAVKAGSELRERFFMIAPVFEDGTVTGIRGRGPSGKEIVEKARIVIGADGKHSGVARAVGAREYRQVGARTCLYYGYFRETVPITRAELYRRAGHEILGFPTNDGQACIAVYRPHAAFAQYRANVESTFVGDLREFAPHLAERVSPGSREGAFAGTADTRNFFRKAYGPGWTLVGDAGYHQDPITGQGISDAFRDAELLAAAIDAGFGGHRDLEQALALYEDTRDRIAGPMYEGTLQATLLPSPEPMIPVLEEVNRDPDLRTRFFSSFAGTALADELLVPQFLERTAG